MLRKLQQIREKEEGFTIIEVLIVLAIAALILVIVLIAIPQLQRNQRNTARKNDVSRIATTVNEFQSNNNGGIPCPTGATVAQCNADLDAIRNSAGTLGQYDLTANQPNKRLADAAGTANVLAIVDGTQAFLQDGGAGDPNLGSMQLVRGAVCGNNGATVADANPRKYAIQFLSEAGGGTGVTPVCQNVQ